ncbi:MAG TPA: type III-A CRISPR-associated RAMP protein Csm4 [Candidatus Hydrogenedentes bacterium]|nr:type III-A CRISPR-associated RAMP protein Csm4 [Candidatus Hydrogenedentota bacterium]HPC15466.1 type III-A CRISPR-associated RAMP protein Csm4 [Candidatus Hydrogenedentota bacterium]HRT20257.1 type III-A CRISPR-associated RAMP protein Csm4 [Candidatus Hydrogenedentota bacterium]HRT64320.1 type III-A CRISPR-associated RAMP protein Csm4 [Candidatus Hydrogenedentota bacterium]
MTRYRVQLEPMGPFFTGMNSHARKAAALIHSDTLHGALMTVAAVGGSPWLDEAPRLRVSSLFPCWKNIHFYPKPFLPVPGVRDPKQSGEEDDKGRKQWKSIRLVSEGLLAAWLRGDPSVPEQTEVLGSGLAALKPEMDGKPRPLNAFLVRDLAPAVTVDRCAAGATPYDRHGLRLNTEEGVGAWFLVELPPERKDSFLELAALLGTYGLGGERTVGYGRFNVLGMEELPTNSVLERTNGANAVLTLSLYHPTRAEIAAGVLEGIAAYDCTLRGGWIHGTAGSDRPKRALRMCLEGSVFPALNGVPPNGDVIDVRPVGFDKHPIWRSGLAFPAAFQHPGQTN